MRLCYNNNELLFFKRDKERFLDDFMFVLTTEEMKTLSISQKVISIQSTGKKGGRTKPVNVFTE